MALRKVQTIIFLAQIAWAPIAAASESIINPSLEQARLNAFPIFNSIHSAMRQWGSSLNHNGLAMIPAKVPKDGLLYHGTHAGDTKIVGPEWLAFEPEHSEIFATSWRLRQENGLELPEQVVLGGVEDRDEQTPEILASAKQPAIRGYLRTYQVSRDLNLLYIDGMSAAKGCLGTLDTQDLVLRMINGTSPCDTELAGIMEHDIARVGELCNMISPLGYDGLLRTEVGFEIVYCDFDDGGLRLLSQMRRPFWDQMKAWYNYARLAFNVIRVATQHYDGMAGAGRVHLDFSRMVSAYFYPVNITDPDGDADKQAPSRLLPRLLSTTHHERRSIQRRVQEVAGSSNGPVIDWQRVVDAIVSRYADRLTSMAHLSPDHSISDAQRFAAEVFVVTNAYIDFPRTPDDVTVLTIDEAGEAAARTRCQNHYLQQVERKKNVFTPEDRLIHAAITQVTGRICGTLFHLRSDIQSFYQSEHHGRGTRQSALSSAAETGRQRVQSLIQELQWTRWEKCGDCAADELCFVPMFPFGSKLDGQGPHCLNESGVDLGLDLENNYWHIDIRGCLMDVTEPF